MTQVVATGWIASFATINLDLWSGDEPLNFMGRVYSPGHFIQLDHAGNEVGTPTRRMAASFSVADPALRASLLEDSGPLLITARFIHSTDHGATWNLTGNQFMGRLSNPRLSGGVYTTEVETYSGDIDRGRPRRWSHESQVKRGGGGDLAFEMGAQLASGLETRWPP